MGKTLLLAESNVEVRQMLRTILERSDFRVLEAQDAREAVQLGRSHPGEIDLLVLDAVLPPLTAPQLAEHMTALRPELKVIYMSGYSQDILGEQNLLARTVPFLQKPFSPSLLLDAVRQALARSARE